jgi:hypothetical protein
MFQALKLLECRLKMSDTKGEFAMTCQNQRSFPTGVVFFGSATNSWPDGQGIAQVWKVLGMIRMHGVVIIACNDGLFKAADGRRTPNNSRK